MESVLKTINFNEILNPKSPYECHAIRKNPDLTKLEREESLLFRENYEEYTMTSGQKVYQREITIYEDWYEDDYYPEIQIISREEWEQLPIQSTSKLVKFRKNIESCVWKSRGSGIHHYSKWSEFQGYYFDEMFKEIAIPKLEFTEPMINS